MISELLQVHRLRNCLTKTSIVIVARIYLAIVICWQIVIYTSIQDFWLFRLINNFDAWLYLPLAFFSPCLFYRQIRKKLLILLLVPFAIFCWEYSWYVLPKWDDSRASTSLRLMTWNLSYENPHPQAIASMIKFEHPDIVAVQELVKSTASELSQALSQDFTYRVIPPTFEFGIFSKYPLKSSRIAELNPQVSKFQEVSVSIGQREIELIDVHLPVPKLQTRQFGLFTLPIDFNTNNWDVTYPILLDRIAKTDRPLLVVGDFNTSDRDRNYHLLNRSLSNAFQTTGWGFGMTYPIASPVEIPLVRIDHIFYSQHWRARSAWTHKGVGSDHQYLVADLRLD
jgi:endonuclease/exonuclease/phosphatase (EEP) superfamily protein YafD